MSDAISREAALECFMGYDRTGDIKDAIAALPAVTPGVRVKPLAWHPVNMPDALCHDEWVAEALGGAFHIAPDEDSASGAWIMQWTICHEHFCMAYGGAITRYPDGESAKAAAQADYEARILAALDLTPQPAPDVVRLVEAMKVALEVMEAVDGENDCSRGIDALEKALAAMEGK